jgi:hypothetical protein
MVKDHFGEGIVEMHYVGHFIMLITTKKLM